MHGPTLRLLAAAAGIALLQGTIAHAQSDPERGLSRIEEPGSTAVPAETEWSLHTALEGDRRPFLCKGRDSVNLIVEIMARALEARDSDADKTRRMLEIAAKLQAELCTRPAAEDIVILRCNLAQRAVSRANISTIKVSAVLRSEPSKGEQPFFAWTYRNITDSKSSAADTRSANSRWCADVETEDEAVNPTADVVVTLQMKLYDMGMPITQVNGVMTPETSQSVVNFQKWAGLPATGQLTQKTLQKLAELTLPSAWVAIAFDGSGNYGVDTGATRRGTEASALERLQRVSRSSYKVSSIAEACLAIATTRYGDRRRTFTQAFTSSGRSSAAAKENVMAYCDHEKTGGRCELRHALCAEGAEEQAQRYDKNSIPVNARPPRFDPRNEPVNTPNPNQRFDPSNIPANAPNPNQRFDPGNLPLNSPMPTR
jgi:peptidoglycan hydrolase-like protein with peptidoglycan-binding domain